MNVKVLVFAVATAAAIVAPLAAQAGEVYNREGYQEARIYNGRARDGQPARANTTTCKTAKRGSMGAPARSRAQRRPSDACGNTATSISARTCISRSISGTTGTTDRAFRPA